MTDIHKLFKALNELDKEELIMIAGISMMSAAYYYKKFNEGEK